METNSNNTQPKTPMLNTIGRIKRWFTRRRCIFLSLFFILFCFFYNPTKIDLIFKAIPENAIIAVYVDSLSEEWDGTMENNMLMGSISVALKEDLTSLREDDGVKWTLRLLTGEDSVAAVIDTNENGKFDFHEGDYLVGATSVGFRRRIMELLWRIKYVPGLGSLSVTDDGIRYLDFSKHKVGPSPHNPVLALDMVDGVLCVAYTANPSDLNFVTSRVNNKAQLAKVFNSTEKPWELRSNKTIPQNYIIWHDDFDGVCGLSSLSTISIEMRLLCADSKLHESFKNFKTFKELGISGDKLAAKHVAVDDVLFCSVMNQSISERFDSHLLEKEEHGELRNDITSLALLSDPYDFKVLGNSLPSIHFSTTQEGIQPGFTKFEMLIRDVLKESKNTYKNADNWRTIYTPRIHGDFDFVAANIRFGAYVEQKGKIYNQGVANLKNVTAGTELPTRSVQGAYTLGEMFDFFAEECGTSYFIAYCNLKELLKLTNMLQVNLKLATMFGVKLEKEDVQTFYTVALVVDKLAEADTLSVGISRIEEEETKNLLNSKEVYCMSISLIGKDK